MPSLSGWCFPPRSPSVAAARYPEARMLSVAILGAGQLGSGVAAILRERATHHVLGPFGRAAREQALGSSADVVLIATTTRFRDVEIGRASCRARWLSAGVVVA